ncbi:histone-binding protein SET3 [Rhizophagus irregularis DAOM 181602=DAOM 197198]|nr:histone-binding protein SET3 [Rhizophagus irregularis DAOM 181602=DAOM 197198]
MKVDPNVKEYKCHNCSDIKVEKSLRDGKKSKKYQKIRRETDSGVYSSPAPQMSESSIIGTSNKSRNRSSDLSFVIKERQSSHSKEYEPIEKNIIASKAVEELFPKIYSQYQHRKRSMSLSSTSKTDNEHNRDDNQETLSIRSTSPSLEIGNPFNMEKESLARPFMKTIVKQVRSKMLKKNSNCYGLFAETNISPGLFIVEFKGEVCLKSDYKANESNQYSLLGVTQPFVLFYPVLNLCVDARRVGTEARFIRRSCHPNAETRTIVVPGGDEVHLGIFSKFEILKGKEITIGWDWESNHIANSLIQLQDSVSENDDDENTLAKKRDEIGKTTAAILRLTECACENKDDCIIYKMQNEGKTLSKSRKNKKLVMDVEEMLIEGEKETSPGINDEDYEDDMDSSQKKRDNVSLTRKINRKGKQNVESSLNGNNKNFSEDNEVSNQIGRKDKKRVKESDAKSDNIAPYSQKNKGKESANRVREETSGNIKRKSLSSRKSTSSRHARSLSSSKRRQQHEDDEEQLSDSSLSSVNSEMSLDDDTSIVEVSPPADKNIPNEHINKENNEDQLSEHSIETEVNDILLQSSATPPRPLPPAISQIPFKDYLIQMHEWKKAIEAISNSASTESDRPSSPILHESNMETTSENVEPENIGKSKGLKSHDEDLITDKDEEIDHDQRLVPLPTPIIPAKRVASSPGPTLNNQNGKYLYNENGSDIKGKRQKTEELQGLSKGKGKETEIEKEEVQSSTPDNRDSVESTILIKTSGDLKKQVMDSSITHSSTNETSKTMTSKPRKLSLNEYRSQLAITALNKETLEKKSTSEDSKSPISSATEIDKKDNKTIDNNDTSSSLPVNASIKTKLSLKEYQDKIRLAESSNNSSVDVTKKSIDLVPTNTEELKQKSDVIENKQINEQTKSEEVVDLTVISTSPKSPKLPKTEDNKSSLINDGYFPDVDFRFDFPITPLDTSKDINAFTTNEFGRHANSSHSDGSYEETRGRHSPYKDYSSMKSSGNYNSSYNIPLGDTSMQTSPRPEHTSPPRGPRYYGGGHFRGNRMGGSYRGMSMSPGDRGRYHSGSGYFNSAGSLPATPRQGAQSSIMTSSASSPYDPANPDGQSANTSNERDPILDNNSIMGNNSGSGIAMESKARDFARSGGDRSDLRDRWSYNNYASMDRSREREWRERERDDGRKDWNNKRLDHYREREYTGTSELPRYPMMVTRRHSNQDRYMIGGSVPTGPAAGMNPSPSGISKNSEQPSSSNNPSQRFGVDDHRRNRR